MIRSIILFVLFLLGFVYILWPGPKSIVDVPALPNSLQSDEPGDTYQNPNNKAYFSEYRRSYVTNYYKSWFSYINISGVRVPPFRMNHPPEEAAQYIRDQQKGTYLEEYAYPLRDALFVNGYEPFNENGKPFDGGSTIILVNGKFYDTKTTLRYYGSPTSSRIFVYILSWIGILWMVNLFGKVAKEKV